MRRTVDPAFTFGVSLVLSLLLWWPTLRGLLAGDIDITDAALRYLAALGLAWLGVYGVATLVAGYGHEPRPAPRPPAGDSHPGRRTSDTPDHDAAEQPAA